MAQKVQSLAAAGVANTFSNEQYVKYDDPGVEPTIEHEHELQDQLFEIIRPRPPTGTRTRHRLPCKRNKLPPNRNPLANEPSFLQDDQEPGPRGCGMKIFNVSPADSSTSTSGFLDPIGSQTHTQDLMFNNAPLLELRDLPTTLDIFTIRERHFRDPAKIPTELKNRKDASLQLAPIQLPNHHFLAYTMYSQSAYRWGPYVAKYALFPTTSVQQQFAKNHIISDSSDPEQHRLWLTEFFTDARNIATYDLRVQLCQDLRVQSVEDTGVAWDERAFPFQTIGQVELPGGQHVFSPRRRTFWDDAMKLNLCYGLEAHRPLSSVNRLRKELYQRSSAFRADANARDLLHVKDVDEIP